MKNSSSPNSSYASWTTAIPKTQQFGEVIKTSNGNPTQWPYVSIANKHADTMLRCAEQLGLTPAARIKLLPPRNETEF